MTILLIDDSRTMRNILQKKLQDLGYDHFLHADDGKAGLKLLQANIDTVDTIFVDAHMPAMDGFAFLRSLRQIGIANLFNLVMISSHQPQLDHAKSVFADIAVMTKPVDTALLASFMKTLPLQTPDISKDPFATKATPGHAVNFYFYEYEQKLQEAASYTRPAKNFTYHEFKPFIQYLHARFEKLDPKYAGDRIHTLFDQFYRYERCYSGLSLLDNTSLRKLCQQLVLDPQTGYRSLKDDNSDPMAAEAYERRMLNEFESLHNSARQRYKKAFKTVLENRLKALSKAVFAAANTSDTIKRACSKKGFSLPLKPRSYTKELLSASSPDSGEYKHLLTVSSLLQRQKRKQVSIINEDMAELQTLKELILDYDSELVVQGLRSFRQLMLHQSAVSPDLIIADFAKEQIAEYADTIKDKYDKSDFLLLFRSRSKALFEQAVNSGLVFTTSQNFLHAPAYLHSKKLHSKLEDLL